MSHTFLFQESRIFETGPDPRRPVRRIKIQRNDEKRARAKLPDAETGRTWIRVPDTVVAQPAAYDGRCPLCLQTILGDEHPPDTRDLIARYENVTAHAVCLVDRGEIHVVGLEDYS